MQRVVALGLGAWLVLFSPVARAQEPAADANQAATDGNQPAAEGSPEYKRTIDSALEEYKLGHFVEARSLFEHAHTLDPNARTLRGLGMVEFELRHYVRAADLLEASLASTKKPLTEDQRKAVSELLQRTRQFIASYSLDVAPDRQGLVLEIDGKPVELDSDKRLSLEAGEHTLRISAPDLVARELHIDVQGGEHQTLRIELEVKPPADSSAPPPVAENSKTQPERTRPYAGLGIALAGVGGGAVLAGIVLGTLAVSKAGDSPTSDGSKADSAHTMALASDVSIGAGLACAVAGVVLLTIRETKTRAQNPSATRVDAVLPNFRMRF